MFIISLRILCFDHIYPLNFFKIYSHTPHFLFSERGSNSLVCPQTQYVDKNNLISASPVSTSQALALQVCVTKPDLCVAYDQIHVYLFLPAVVADTFNTSTV